MPTPTPPDGWSKHDRTSPLTAPWEPIWARRGERALALAVEVREPHCNSRGLAHGGLICALADNAMGLSVIAAARADGIDAKGALTVSLNLDFVDAARPGELLEIHPEVIRVGRTLGFVECRVRVGERTLARGSATFRLG
ncbi:MAG: PaaI family thioesterase [Burkholderiales bacterium]